MAFGFARKRLLASPRRKPSRANTSMSASMARSRCRRRAGPNFQNGRLMTRFDRVSPNHLYAGSTALRQCRRAQPDPVRSCSAGTASAIWFCQIDALSRAKDNALTGLEIGRDRPQPQRHIERIKAQRRPEGQLADPMLFHMAGRAQRDGVAIARLHADTAIGSGTHMRGLGWCGFAAGDARQLPDKGQVLPPSTKIGLTLAARHRARDARGGRWHQKLPEGSQPGTARDGLSRARIGFPVTG
jgi:hypothetical protein